MTTATVLSVTDLMVGYSEGRAERVIAKDLNLELKAGELVCLLGPNGAGKSTLLRTLCAMQPALRGDIRVDGTSLGALTPLQLAKLVSVVLTDRVSVGLLRVYDLVAVGRHPYTGWSGRLQSDDRRTIRWALEAVGSWSMAQRFVSELSDGERQRVMMARALAQEPRLMVLDEITAFLDLPHRIDAMRILRSLAHDDGRAILVSTHDLDLALRTSDRIWLMQPGGSISVGAPEDLVLAGSFSEAFQADGILFDRETGTFELPHKTSRRARILGDGTIARWTARALERVGYGVAPEGCDAKVRVEVRSSDQDTTWRVAIDAQIWEHPTIYALCTHLRAIAFQDAIRSLGEPRSERHKP